MREVLIEEVLRGLRRGTLQQRDSRGVRGDRAVLQVQQMIERLDVLAPDATRGGGKPSRVRFPAAARRGGGEAACGNEQDPAGRPRRPVVYHQTVASRFSISSTGCV